MAGRMRSSGGGVNLQQYAALLADDVLREVEAAAALNFATEAGVGFLRRRAARARSLADLAFRDSVADADDHASLIIDNANHSQLNSQPRRTRLAMTVAGR